MESMNRLERLLIEHGWAIKLIRSNITRGWTYNSDLYRIVPTGRFYEEEPKTEIKRFVPHGAGHGANPALAIINAAGLTNVRTADVLVAIMECEADLLLIAYREMLQRKEQARLMSMLDDALDDLTGLVRSVIVPSPALASKSAPVVITDEDDDL